MTAPLRRRLPGLHDPFHMAAAPGSLKRKREKTAPPFSLRLSVDERRRLKAAAGATPLGAYIRERLFKEQVTPRRQVKPAPVKDHMALAQVLGMLGNLRLANNLNQLARAANIGTLPLTPEVEEEVIRACAAVLAIRAELMRALGYQVGDQS